MRVLDKIFESEILNINSLVTKQWCRTSLLCKPEISALHRWAIKWCVIIVTYIITLARASYISGFCELFCRSVHNSHLWLHSNVAYILLIRSRFRPRIFHALSLSCRNLFKWPIFLHVRLLELNKAN